MKYDRFFAFGCSFTSWHWITWADIIGREFGEGRYNNLGMCASGNEFAFHRLTEAHARFNITKKDLVVICWTNFSREDRWIDGWKLHGNVFSQEFYDKHFLEKYFDLKGALIKSASLIAGATHLLNDIGCDYVFCSAFPMTQIDQHDSLYTGKEFDDVFTVYRNYFDSIQPSMVEHLYGKNVWQNPNPVMVKFHKKDKKPWPDHHPNVLQHLKYTQDLILPKLDNKIDLSVQTINWVNGWNALTRKEEYFLCENSEQNYGVRWHNNHSKLL